MTDHEEISRPLLHIHVQVDFESRLKVTLWQSMNLDGLITMLAGQYIGCGRCVDVKHCNGVSRALLVEREKLSPDKSQGSRSLSRRIVGWHVVRINIDLIRGADRKKRQRRCTAGLLLGGGIRGYRA